MIMENSTAEEQHKGVGDYRTSEMYETVDLDRLVGSETWILSIPPQKISAALITFTNDMVPFSEKVLFRRIKKCHNDYLTGIMFFSYCASKRQKKTLTHNTT